MVDDLRGMVGKTVLAGITYVDAEGEVTEQVQLAGEVVVDPDFLTSWTVEAPAPD